MFLEDLFDENTRDKAHDMIMTGKVKKPEWGDDGELLLTVRDDRNYSVMVNVDYDGLLIELTCNCEAGRKRIPCVHMAAACQYFEAFTGTEIMYDSDSYREEDKRFLPDFDNNMPDAKEGTDEAEKDDFSSEESGSADSDIRKDSALPELGGILSELETLQKDTRSVRIKDQDYSNDRSGEEYRFFRYEEFGKGLRCGKDTVRAAKALLKNKINSFDVGTGYTDSQTGAQEMIGYASIQGTGNRGVYNTWEANLYFGRNRLLNAACRTWSCSKQYYGSEGLKHEMCEHTYACYLHLMDYLKDHTIGDSTNGPASRFINYVTKNSRQADEEGTVKDLRLLPMLNLNADYLNESTLSFRAGTDKLYVVKDLTELVNNIENEKEYTFGKNSTIRLSRSRLDESGLKWFDFIKKRNTSLQRAGKIANHLRTAGRSYYYGYREYSYTLGKELDLNEDVLDEFFETGKGTTVDCKMEINGHKHSSVIGLTERSLPIQLSINKDIDIATGEFRGVVLEGDTPETFSGAAYTYYVENMEFVRVVSENDGLVRSLLAEEQGGYIRLQIGRSQLKRFYDEILPALKTIADVTEYDTEEIRSYIPPEPEFAFFLDVIDGMIVCRPDVYYGPNSYLLTEVIRYGAGAGADYDRIRDFDAEYAAIECLHNFLPEYDEEKQLLFCEKDDEIVFRLLDHGLDEIMELGEVYSTDRFKRLIVKKDVKFSMGVSVESNLMNLEITSDELSREDLMEIFNGYKRRQSFVRLKSGEFIKLDSDNNMAMLSEMLENMGISVKDFVKGRMHIPSYRALYLDKMLEQMQGVYADRDKHFKTLIKEFGSIGNSDYELPYSLKTTMRNYQQLGYKWLRTLDQYGFGGILADDMGLGKTLQVISVIKAVHDDNPEAPGTSLVVCPASLVYNWGEEIKRFAPELKFLLILGTRNERSQLVEQWRDYDILVTSYDLLKRDIDCYNGKRFRFQIIDEAQYIKNHNTEAARTVKLVEADTKYALTGTPIENRLSELWSIFDYLMPGLLYKYSDFHSRLELPIVKYEDDGASETLRRMVHPFVLRRVKKDVLKDLPDKLEEVRYAGMDKKQSRLYDAQVLRMRKSIDKKDDASFNKSKIEILAELTRIRQICCDPSLCFEDYEGGSAKLEACMELIGSLIDGGHKTLVFSQFTSMLAILERELEREGIAYYKITGSTPKEARMDMVKKFNADETPVFLISLKAGGTGLNLTGADAVIHYDPWWNVAAQNQATDRAHRIGQTRVVTVYRLIVKNTIEEKILVMQEMKKKLADDILSGENVSNIALTKEDLLMLLE